MMNIELAKMKYKRNVYFYDFVTQAFSSVRSRAIAQMRLKPGDVALDFGCGTGLSFDLIEQVIGPNGKIIGVDLSQYMLAKAREKISANSWKNIELIESNAEEANLPPDSVDAVISFYTHDIMSSPQAVNRAVQALRPGGTYVAAGTKLVTGRRGRLINPITLAYANTAITVPLTERPWIHLEEMIAPLRIQELLLGSAYIACGQKA